MSESEQTFQTYAMEAIPLWKWIPGIAAMSGTPDEAAWKDTLTDAIPEPPEKPVAEGLSINFFFDGTAPREQDLMMIGLAEPVLDVLIHHKGWFAGQPTNIRWITMGKSHRRSTLASLGCRIEVFAAPTGTISAKVEPQNPLFTGVYDSEFNAHDGGQTFRAWLHQIVPVNLAASHYGIALRFPDPTINLEEISAEPTRSILNSLSVMLSGTKNARDDWRITSLRLSKTDPTVTESGVRVTVKRSWEPVIELRRGSVLLGTLEEYDGDFPWLFCEFEPTPEFQPYASLFDALEQTTAQRDTTFSERYDPIERLGLRLVSGDREATSILLRINTVEGKARFRGQFHRIADSHNQPMDK